MPSGVDAVSWDIPIVGFRVTDVWFSGRISVVAYGSRAEGERDAPRTMASFGGPFHFEDPSRTEHHLSASEPWDTNVPLLALRHDRISKATANTEGELLIEFESGARLTTGPDDQYENWELSGPGTLNLVGMPGGGDPRISGSLT